MPVYLFTIHAFASWSEDNPRGYVQRGEGLKPPDPARARWRREHASQPPVRFTRPQQELAHRVALAIADERQFRLHACTTTRTRLHPEPRMYMRGFGTLPPPLPRPSTRRIVPPPPQT